MTSMITVVDLHFTMEPVTVAVDQVSAALRPWFEPWGPRFVDMAENFGAALAADDDPAARELAGYLGVGFERLPEHVARFHRFPSPRAGTGAPVTGQIVVTDEAGRRVWDATVIGELKGSAALSLFRERFPSLALIGD